MAITFDVTDYRRSHAKSPEGWGVWAFSFDRDNPEDFTFTPRAMFFTDAKTWARAIARETGVDYIVVGP